MELLVLMVIVGVVSGLLSAVVASSKNYNGTLWFVLGFFFPAVAPIVIIFFKDTLPSGKTHVKCPECQELVLKEAKVCKHCGVKLIPQIEQAPKFTAKLQKQCPKCYVTNEAENTNCWKCDAKF